MYNASERKLSLEIGKTLEKVWMVITGDGRRFSHAVNSNAAISCQIVVSCQNVTLDSACFPPGVSFRPPQQIVVISRVNYSQRMSRADTAQNPPVQPLFRGSPERHIVRYGYVSRH